jgi:hypothetical protein
VPPVRINTFHPEAQTKESVEALHEKVAALHNDVSSLHEKLDGLLALLTPKPEETAPPPNPPTQ